MPVVQGGVTDMPAITVLGPDAKGIQLETIKRGEGDGKATKSMILRMHESFGGRARGQLKM